MSPVTTAQAGILPPSRPYARYLTAHLRDGVADGALRAGLGALDVGAALVAGLGPALAERLGAGPEAFDPFPDYSGHGVDVPSTQADLWLWVRGDAPGDVVLAGRALVEGLQDLFDFDAPVDGFKHGEASGGRGRDLTGYEDGTENPEGDDAAAAALAADGSSIVAVQCWKHDLPAFYRHPPDERDLMIGRRLSDNHEFEDSPPSAHTRRTAQESFDPEAFLLRRSLPWAGPRGEGLMFVAFGHSAYAFDVQMRRMAGQEDGITDALFLFSSPVTGGYYWCPPQEDGALML